MSAVAVVIFVIIAGGAYFIPGIVGSVRHVPNTVSVWVINFFLGWTLVGWVVALAMAVRSQPTLQQVIVQQGWHGGPPQAPGEPWNPTQPYEQPPGWGQQEQRGE